MRKALVVRTDGTREVVDLDAPEGSLKVLQDAVGGYVDAIALSPEHTLWVNDEGKLIGLPVNEFGTRVFQATHATMEQIVGNVVVTGGVDAEGNTMALDDETVALYTFATIH